MADETKRRAHSGTWTYKKHALGLRSYPRNLLPQAETTVRHKAAPRNVLSQAETTARYKAAGSSRLRHRKTLNHRGKKQMGPSTSVRLGWSWQVYSEHGRRNTLDGYQVAIAIAITKAVVSSHGCDYEGCSQFPRFQPS